MLGACGNEEKGPIAISAIGSPPALVDPNRRPLDPPSSLLAGATAQGLVRFEASGQIEPALAQRWIISDDGLRYTFRLARTEWDGGGKVTAQQVVQRLRAAMASGSRNPLKPLLGAIDEIEAMTDEVVEIGLKAPRPNFLQLLAQPELAIIREGKGTGPFRVRPRPEGVLRLRLPQPDESEAPSYPTVLLRGQRAALAVATFQLGDADMVTGGTMGDLPIARTARVPGAVLRFDPVAGLFGLVFLKKDGILSDPEGRRALSMAVDRPALIGAVPVPGLQPRESIVPPGIAELPQAAQPDWQSLPLPARRAAAAQTIATLAKGERVRLRVALPAGPGYRLAFLRLRSAWRAIHVDAEAVGEMAPADLRLVDRVAPVTMVSWYLRNFTCEASVVCSPEADQAMAEARLAPNLGERRLQLALAERLLEDQVVFISLAAPVRWHLVSDRLTGFQANVFGRHPLDQLVPTER